VRTTIALGHNLRLEAVAETARIAERLRFDLGSDLGYRYPGADLGILVTRGRFMNDEHELADRARDWITGIKSQFRSVALDRPPAVQPEPFGFKML